MDWKSKKIPICLAEAISLLNQAQNETAKAQIQKVREDDLAHMDAVMVLCDEWALEHENSPLRVYFRKLGVDQLEDCLAIILRAFWRVINQRPLAVQGLVAEYSRFWKETETCAR